MIFEIVQSHCLSKKGVAEEFPFDNETMVWKVMGKIFCLGNINHFDSVNLKCDPAYALELRELHTQIVPGYHMNKTLWNTVYFDGLSEKLILDLIDHSYEEVVRKLPKNQRESLKNT
jgi:predicted DNA-binding protein (MmcQ/YjbR family)